MLSLEVQPAVHGSHAAAAQSLGSIRTTTMGRLTGFTGGYEIIQHKLMRSGMYSHTASYPEAISDRFLDAINVVQSTEWQVNDFIFDTMLTIREEGGSLGGIPTCEDEALPEN